MDSKKVTFAKRSLTICSNDDGNIDQQSLSSDEGPAHREIVRLNMERDSESPRNKDYRRSGRFQAVKQGWMFIRKGKEGWVRRYVRLFYYRLEWSLSPKTQAYKETMLLENWHRVEQDMKDKLVFRMFPCHKSPIKFSVDSVEEVLNWMKAIEKVVDLARHTDKSEPLDFEPNLNADASENDYISTGSNTLGSRALLLRTMSSSGGDISQEEEEAKNHLRESIDQLDLTVSQLNEALQAEVEAHNDERSLWLRLEPLKLREADLRRYVEISAEKRRECLQNILNWDLFQSSSLRIIQGARSASSSGAASQSTNSSQRRRSFTSLLASIPQMLPMKRTQGIMLSGKDVTPDRPSQEFAQLLFMSSHAQLEMSTEQERLVKLDAEYEQYTAEWKIACEQVALFNDAYLKLSERTLHCSERVMRARAELTKFESLVFHCEQRLEILRQLRKKALPEYLQSRFADFQHASRESSTDLFEEEEQEKSDVDILQMIIT
jgi:hypothetical protein